MDMQKAKLVIAHFLKIEAGDIDNSTVMNHTAVPSSLLLHRMYAALADEGYILEDPAAIVNFGDFSRSFSANVDDFILESIDRTTTIETNEVNSFISSGIDIEEVLSIENTDDYANNIFYQENFSKEEIQYCVAKADPRQSFAGLFSAKEAIVKADSTFKKTKFNQINITHNVFNKPIFEGFSISISHSKNYAVAIASKVDLVELRSFMTKEIQQVLKSERKKQLKLVALITALSLSLITISFLVFFYDFY